MNSLVVVLPMLPVMPTTLTGRRREDRVGEGLEGGDGVPDLDQAEPGSGTATGRETTAPAGAVRRGVGDEVVAVPPARRRRRKARLDEPAGNRCRRPERSGRESPGGSVPAGDPGDLVEPQCGHASNRPHPARTSLMTSISLKWMVRSLKI